MARLTCGQCGREGTINPGWRIRGGWVRCDMCVATWMRITFDKGRDKPGRSGIPSDATLRKRR